MQHRELSVTPRAQVPPRHVDVINLHKQSRRILPTFLGRTLGLGGVAPHCLLTLALCASMYRCCKTTNIESISQGLFCEKLTNRRSKYMDTDIYICNIFLQMTLHMTIQLTKTTFIRETQGSFQSAGCSVMTSCSYNFKCCFKLSTFSSEI